MSRARLLTPEQERARYGWLAPVAIAERLSCTPEKVCDEIKLRRLRAINIGTDLRPMYRVKPEWFDLYLEEREDAIPEPEQKDSAA